MAGDRVRPGRLRRRLTIAFVLVAGFSAAAPALGSYLLVRQARFDDSLRQAAADARYQLVLAGQFGPLDAPGPAAELLASFEASGRHVVLVTPAGATPSDRAVDPQPDPAVRVRAARGQLVYQRVPGHLLLVGGPVAGTAAQLYLIRDEDRIYRDLDQWRTALLAASGVVLLLAAVVGGVLARRTLAPVGRASAAARAVAEGLLATRLPAGRDEFGSWAQSFNRMAEALEAKIGALHDAQARERRFTADVAHELRTPVTALVAAASLLREHLTELPEDARRPAELMVADATRLRRLVEELMEISRLDAGQEDVAPVPVELTGLVRSIVDSRGWSGRVAVDGVPVPVRTDPRRVERVVANLVANALEHGGAPVVVRVCAAGGRVTVEVEDGGPGVPAEHLPRLFERFYKADPARGSGRGSGLGLAIAAENARLLGGDLAVRNLPDRGARFTLTLNGAPP